jgi:hypothetical protein
MLIMSGALRSATATAMGAVAAGQETDAERRRPTGARFSGTTK